MSTGGWGNTGGAVLATGGAGPATGGATPAGGTNAGATGGRASGGAGSGGRMATGGGANGGSATGGTMSGGQGGAIGSGGIGGLPTGGSASGTGGEMQSGSGGRGPCEIDLDCRPETLPTSGDFAEDCVNRINQFRVECFCMEPLQRWNEAEVCAEQNAEYDQQVNEPHAGWGSDGVCSEDSGDLARSNNGFATNECPGYPSVQSVISTCLLQMYQEGAQWEEELGRPPTQADYEDCSGSCYSKYGHFIAMTSTSYSRVACGITEDPDYWSVQNFR